MGFVGEMFIYMSCINLGPFVLIPLSLLSILLPVYIVWMLHRMSYGAVSKYFGQAYPDITIKEFHLLFPLLFLIVYFGLFPGQIIESIAPALSVLIV